MDETQTLAARALRELLDNPEAGPPQNRGIVKL
jgi:hypothetical protein